jgi:hypothetical protein
LETERDLMTNAIIHPLVCDGLCCEKKNVKHQDNRKVCKLYGVITHLKEESKLIELETEKEMPNYKLPCAVNMPKPVLIVVANLEDD